MKVATHASMMINTQSELSEKKILESSVKKSRIYFLENLISPIFPK
jgi:hypothetical protein